MKATFAARSIFIILLLACSSLFGQDRNELRKEYYLGFSYYGDINSGAFFEIQPGFRVEGIVPLKTMEFIRTSERKEILKSTFGAVNIVPHFAYYKRRNYHHALMTGIGLSYTTTLNSGFFMSLMVEPGYMYTILDGEVLEKNDEGEFQPQGPVGYSYATIAGAGRFGYDMLSGLDVPLSIFFELGLFYSYPHNEEWLRQQRLQIGIHYIFERVREK